MDKEIKNLRVFGYGLGLISFLFGIIRGLKHGFHLVSWIFLICCAVFITVTCFDLSALKPGYRAWMKVAHWIGNVFSTIILSIIFILIFTPIGLFFRMIGKDHLQRTLDPKAKTYWRGKKKELFQKERYKQQF